jgi:methyl-accepting chemotaxis protein
MNTQLAFAFGMLAMTAIVMLVAIVVGIVKAFKNSNQIDTISNELTSFMDKVRNSPALDDLSKEFQNEIKEVNLNAHSRMDAINHRIDDEVRDINSELNDMRRQSDSRFDKTGDRISSQLNMVYDRIDYIEELLKSNGITTTNVKPITIKDIEKVTGKHIIKG